MKWSQPSVDALKYQATAKVDDKALSAARIGELLTVKIRYKEPTGDVSTKQEFALKNDRMVRWDDAAADTRWAASVALLGMVLRNSEYAGSGSFDIARSLASGALGDRPDAARLEFIDLIDKAQAFAKPVASVPAVSPLGK
jgi:Ca-activated chloride channel homolog